MAERLLIAQNTYPDGGGISSILENLIAAVGERYEVHVAVVEAREGVRERLALPAEQVHVHGFSNLINPVLLPTSLAYSWRVGRWLRRLSKQVGPRAIIVQDGLNLPVPGLIAARSAGVPLAVMDHGTLTNVYEPGWAKMVGARLPVPRDALFRLGFAADTPWRAARWRIAVRAADQLWYTGSELEPYFGSAGDRVRRYAQLVPTDFHPPTPAEQTDARKEWGLGPDDVVVNMVGRLDGEKGLEDVLTAVQGADLPACAVFLIAGDGSLRSELERRINGSGLANAIRLVGRLDRESVARLHHASDIHLYAGTISCGMSVCVLEAMASGLIPVVSDVPDAQRELVGDAGWVFRAGDVSALRVALEQATTCSPLRRTELGRQARERVLTGQQGSPLPDLVDQLMMAG